MKPNENLDPLVIGGKSYGSRLLIGTGKYKDFAETKAAVEASGAQIVTVAIRRTNIGQNPGEPNLLDAIPPSKYTLLPNTAGCYTADDAVRTLRLARELLDGHDLVKLEVLGDPKTLYPNVVETIAAAKTLVKDGFKVMVYTSDDPIIAKQLEEIGCVAVMPLASLIGSGMGILNPWNLQIIIESAKVPVVVDAGVAVVEVVIDAGAPVEEVDAGTGFADLPEPDAGPALAVVEEDAGVEAEVDAGTALVKKQPTPKKKGQMNVISTHDGEPYWAQVSIDGVMRGRTPLLLDLPVGKYQVRVERTGFRPTMREVKIAGGKSVVVKVELVQR